MGAFEIRVKVDNRQDDLKNYPRKSEVASTRLLGPLPICCLHGTPTQKEPFPHVSRDLPVRVDIE